MKHLKLFLITLCCTTILLNSCVTTRVEASPHDTNVANMTCHVQSQWSYLWGLGGKERVDVNPETEDKAIECPCREKALAWAEVKTSFTDVLLSIVTIGIVNHRTVEYGCVRPVNNGGDDDMDMDN